MLKRLRSMFGGNSGQPKSENTANGDNVYDALNPKGRRRSASVSQIRPEDLLLNQGRRDRLDANALDVQRNFSLLQWMIRQTLNYVCYWDYHPTTSDDGLNNDLRTLMARDCEAINNDYVGRMSWDDMRRVAESLKIIAGDSFLIPLQEGTLQLIEGSYTRNPQNIDTTSSDMWCSGAKLNARGRITQWNFREFDMSNMYVAATNWKDRQVSGPRVWQHIQYENRANLIRGMGSLTSALNEMRDLYETGDLTRAKIKLEQLFGVAIFRRIDDGDDIAPTVNEVGTANDADPSTVEVEQYDFGNGPVVFDRTVGEDIKILQANSPGANTIDFMRLCIQLVMLALDLPANFYNPSETNFFGSQAAWTLFERSCQFRRESQLRLHKRMTRWRHWRWSLPVDLGGTGEIVLPRGMTTGDLKFKWVPRGVPFWKPTEQLAAGLGRVACGLTTFQGLCDETGSGLYEDNLNNLRFEINKAKEKGFRLKINTARLDVTIEDMENMPAVTPPAPVKPVKAGAS